MNRQTLLLGIGNLVLSDDGFGVHVARALQNRPAPAPGTRVLDGGTLGLALSHELAAADRLIVFDAAELGADPGTLRTFIDAELDGFLRARGRSAHQVGLADLLDAARLGGALPAPRALIAAQPRSLEWGDTLSPELAAAVPAAVDAALALLAAWSGSDPDPAAGP